MTAGSKVVATTTQGRVEGVTKEEMLRFAGIPYAAPPTGTNRFRPPRPADSWSGVRAALSFGQAAWQPPPTLGGVLSGPPPVCAEDCLTLNVQTPALDDGARPVMVWIHGGGFLSGTGAMPWYNGASFVRRGDVVVVSINYRLGAWGFLHLAHLGGEEFASSGLTGILDQVAALEWVRDNIAAFGGDPNNVTIFGESAGAMSIGTLLGLPRARGLFHRAIAQSGAAHNLQRPDRAEHVTDLFCQKLGTSDIDGLLAATPEQLLTAQNALPALLLDEQRAGGHGGGEPALEATAAAWTGGDTATALGMPFQPVVDGIELPVPPIDAIRGGLNAFVPLMTGTTLDEWALFQLSFPGPKDEDGLARRVRRHFPGGDDILATYRAARPELTPADLWSALMTDVVFRVPGIRLAEAQARHQPANTFMYRFRWATPAFGGVLGSCHALEIPFVFNNLERAGVSLLLGDAPAPADLALAMHDSWWRFARTGDPRGDGSDLPPWAPYTSTTRTTMEFDDLVAPVDDPDAPLREAWDQVI